MAHLAMQHIAAQELDSILQSLQSLKPPGVNKAKVDAATKLCMEPQNIPIEPILVDVLSNGVRRSPVTHKLGVLYIIDSITRQWVAAGAAHAGGVRRMTDNLPVLMNELLPVAPENQKDKISKLLDIWLSSKTFPANMLTDFKIRLQNPAQQPLPPQPAPLAAASLPTTPANLLAALAGPPPAQATTPTQPQPPPMASNNTAQLLAALLAQAPPPNPQVPLPHAQTTPVVTFPSQLPVALAPKHAAPVAGQNTYGNMPLAPPVNPNSLATLFPALQPNPQGSAPDASVVAHQMQALQQFAPDASVVANQMQALQQLAQNPEAFKTVLQALGIPVPQLPPVAPVPQLPQVLAVPPMPQNPLTQFNSQPPYAPQSYDRDEDGYKQRNRSRSPDYKRRRVSPPNRRDSPTYGTYDPHSLESDPRGQDDRGRGRGRKGGRNEYRQRSPPANRDTQNDASIPKSSQPKPLGFDNTIPDGQVKVLSRTLFVGGVKTSEADLKNFFRQYGGVQSCIVNHDKRHAFLKLISHGDAMATKAAVWQLPETEYRGLFERVNWAVGFGPTGCANYTTGESLIPIDLLTDADRKWMLTAEYGGTGGQPIQTGMIVEEPDIEIGAGPSSKAIHRRGGGGGGGGAGGGGGGGQNRGGNYFGRRGGGGASESNGGQDRWKKQSRPEAIETHVIAAPPPVPGFGAPIPGFPNFR